MALNTLPQLKSLYINLHQEEQVDLIMRTLQDLEFLNGLKVEREILEEEQEDEEDDENGQGRKSNSPVKEEPFEEDEEDEADYRANNQKPRLSKSSKKEAPPPN
mmetsp:Transcript_39819/g.29375  ORF Transcript_39819/g.29375 Transcript_39819/m.29375 type:complete len:104 (+) Transcript_39819:287-598(+)